MLGFAAFAHTCLSALAFTVHAVFDVNCPGLFEPDD